MFSTFLQITKTYTQPFLLFYFTFQSSEMIGRLNEIVAENTKMVSNIDNIINISLNINTDITKAAISALSQKR